MSVIETILDQSLHELTVCQHLYTKLDPAKANWRPHGNMRTTLELMQYLASIGTSMIEHYTTNPPREGGRERYFACRATTASMTFAEFPAVIERQKEQIQRIYSELTDEELLKRMTYNPFNGQDRGLLDALMFVLRILSAYRHELFMHAKMCGADIYTSNNWAGRDLPQHVAATVAA